jgi:hypothetical protein
MPKRCQICVHQKRPEIERQCLNGVAQTTVAQSHGVSHDAVHRHMRSHLKRNTPGVPANRDSERLQVNERLVAGLRGTLVKELNNAVASGNTGAVAQFARELVRTIDASLKLGEGAGTEAEQTAEPCVVISRDESGEPLEPTAYARWYAALLTPDKYDRWYERRQLPGAVEVAIPWNGRETYA